MKKSTELFKAAQAEDSDFKAMSLHKKAMREKRAEKFENFVSQLIGKGFNTTLVDEGKYTIETEKYGLIDYFPKSNRLLIRKKNEWLYGGLDWIKKNLLTTTS